MNFVHLCMLVIVLISTSITAYLIGINHGVKMANKAFDKAIRAVTDVINERK